MKRQEKGFLLIAKIRRMCVFFISALILFLAGPVTVAEANDESNSSSYLAKYDNDNQVEWTCCYPTWWNFEMAFYNGLIYKMFYRLDAFYEHDCIAYYAHGVDDPPQESPKLTLLDFCDKPILNTPDYRCDQQIAGLRLCAFNGRLYVFYLKADAGYTYGHTWKLCFKLWDDDSETWSQQQTLWTFNGGTIAYQTEPPLGGLVVKVMNGLVHLLLQAGGYPLYAFQFDGAKLVNYDPSHLPAFNLESTSDLLLNGDVFLKLTDDPNDHRECIAFLTKDDGLYKPTGVCKLYVFDPAEGTYGSVIKVTAIPNGPNGKGWKDLAVAQGNVDKCEPYNINALQIWGLPWDDKQLHHIQYIFNDDGKGGNFNSSGWVDVTQYWNDAENSKYYKNGMRGLLAAFSVPSQKTEADGTAALSMHTWVWWFARTSASHCHGRSIKYLSDYLRIENPTQTDTSVEKDPNEAWILLGVITALPPYYPNSAKPADLDGFLAVNYGLSSTKEISSSVTTDNSFSFGYSKKDILKAEGIDGEFGMSYTRAVQHTQKQTSTVTKNAQQTFSPVYVDWPDYPDGQEAWALFLAPNISNDPYQVYAPPETYAGSHPNPGNDLEFTSYYVYTNGTSLRAYSFDITKPDTNPFFKGLSSMPSAYNYKGWSNEAYQRQPTADYEILATTGITAPGSKTTWGIEYEDKVENQNAIKNTIKVSAGAFGFKTDMEGSIVSSSSVSTTIGKSFEITYALYTLYENDPNKYPDWKLFLTDIGFDAYLLNAKTSDAFFIPDSCRTSDSKQYPWCLTWYVNYYINKGGESVGVSPRGSSSGCFIMTSTK